MTQSPHIIIVDDEAPAREMVGDYLKMHGFAVTLCDGGKSLRAAIETTVPDLVVLDLNMPEEDGLSIIRDLKRGRPQRPRPAARRQRKRRWCGLERSGSTLRRRRCATRRAMSIR
jgi:DNA-binding response OmpR family regulator